MNVLITAGGTTEDIDSVRSISNKATGRLGSIIADTFAKADWKVTYVCSDTAILPDCDCLEIVRIRNVAELITTIETLLHTNLYDCVIHSMAVSDFTPQAIFSIDEIAESISQVIQTENIPYDEMPERIRTVINQCSKLLTEKKINSKDTNIALLLRQTPKVIERIKLIQPNTILVGFKLLSNVSEENLLQTGFNLLKQNACDFVLANDLTQIKGDNHTGILISPDLTFQRFYSKQEIANGIFTSITAKIRGVK